MKKLIVQRLKSKLYMLGIFAVSAIPLLQQIAPLWMESIDRQTYAYIISGLGTAMIILRELTKKPLSEK